MQVCLNMIVKNESKIISRALNSVKHLIDSWCIIDTGSTDDTVDIIKRELSHLPGEVISKPWVNFGHNRTEAFNEARKWAEWVLLMDADMQFIDLGFDKSKLDLGAAGYQITQKNSTLSYYNTRILNSKFNWESVGVTHEYFSPNSPVARVEKLESLQINDIGDGGSKGDKFERDIKLLTQGLVDEPNNVRYMFYLAQSYKDTNQFDKAIEWYQKRIEGGGWIEECWHSHYMIANCYVNLGLLDKAEEWVKKGFNYYPKRSEALYMMCKEFRIRGDHSKAYEYYKLGCNIPYPKDDILFIEHAVYSFLFDYELTILHYYLFPEDRLAGLRKSIEYLTKRNGFDNSVHSNLKFYMSPLNKVCAHQETLELPDFPGFVSSSPCKLTRSDGSSITNVRLVNYQLNKEHGTYHYVSDGRHMSWENTKIDPIETKNYLLSGEIMEEEYEIPTYLDSTIHGLEDIRLYESENEVRFLATTKHLDPYSRNRIASGKYDSDSNKIYVEKIFDSPTGSDCEKNWVILNQETLIYSWYPISLYSTQDLSEIKKIRTPDFFQYFRGSSASPVKYKGLNWYVVHSVVYESPRTYLHYLVALDDSGNPVLFSLPFSFEGEKIEYCLSLNRVGNLFEFHYSTWDSTSKSIQVQISYFSDKLIACL